MQGGQSGSKRGREPSCGLDQIENLPSKVMFIDNGFGPPLQLDFVVQTNTLLRQVFIFPEENGCSVHFFSTLFEARRWVINHS